MRKKHNGASVWLKRCWMLNNFEWQLGESAMQFQWGRKLQFNLNCSVNIYSMNRENDNFMFYVLFSCYLRKKTYKPIHDSKTSNILQQFLVGQRFPPSPVLISFSFSYLSFYKIVSKFSQIACNVRFGIIFQPHLSKTLNKSTSC